MTDRHIVVRPGEGKRVRGVEFLATSDDTPRLNVGILEIDPGSGVEPHTHDGEDDAFYVLEGEMTFLSADDDVVAGPGTFVLAPPDVLHGFRNDTSTTVRMLNIHAPAGFDRWLAQRD